MRILVTGGAGFIGSHIVEAYQSAGHHVEIADWEYAKRPSNVPAGVRVHEVDVTTPALEAAFAGGSFDVVNHHAAHISVSVSVREPEFDAHHNVMGSLNVLRMCRQFGVKKVIFASSMAVYGDPAHLPITEELPFAPASPYGAAKAAVELYLGVWAAQFGLKWTVFRYANVYGPRQDALGEAGVVAIFTEQMLGGGKPVIHGDGLNVRDFIYVGDVANASVLALDRADGQVINIGTGKRTTTIDLFRKLSGLTGFRGAEEHGPPRAGDIREGYLDATKARTLLGWMPAVTLDEGLRRTVEWFRSTRLASGGACDPSATEEGDDPHGDGHGLNR